MDVIDPAGPSQPAQPPTEAYRNYAVLIHLCGLLSILSGFPFAGLIAVIVLWQIKNKESAFVEEHGREAANFQITLAVAGAIILVAGVILGIITFGIGFFLFIPAFIGMAILLLIGCIQGAMAASRGESYRYPFTYRFLKPGTLPGGPAV
jgi:uncharacterized Tic20 family protein